MSEAQPARVEVVDLVAAAAQPGGRGPLWTQQTTDLSVNLVVLEPGQIIGESVNAEVDVLLVGIAGEGVVEVNGRGLGLAAGRAVVVPKGARRAIRSAGDRFAYLTCHRRRAGLWPANVPRPGAEPSDTDST
jgi:quercetin dioxygenase-like cupin family protein